MRTTLTPAILARETLRLLSRTPWELRGQHKFWSIHSYRVPVWTLKKSIDDFSENYLSPVTLTLLQEKSFCKDLPELIITDTNTDFASRTNIERFCGFTLMQTVGPWEAETDQMPIDLCCTYEPPEVDQSMPTYFWLGEQGEVVI